ncbi:hypothetical protein J2X72_003118 [Phyllobacterium sp. 1468]|jgi:hypothetical protein|uniref:Uncharacterized protein n=1 Tax=Phyllobacterium trifolii TaxID=300193 RepID=A0A839U8R1_9HYPH|nr:hypothetical protein [Phyllobacterium trifolii]MDR6634308.1 hypothetical protein [Phyllobacterium sp. 1468]
MNPSLVKPAFGDAGTREWSCGDGSTLKSASVRFVCLGLDEPIRTTGNEGVPLQ